MGVGKESPKFWRRWGPPLGWQRGWPLEIRLSPTTVTVPSLIVLGQTVQA